MAKSERNGNRKSRSNFQRRIPDLGYYIVVTDTQETEANYLLGLRNSLPEKIQDRIVIKVETAATKDLVRMCLYHSNMDPQYRQPWIVFDRDQVKDFDQIIANARQNDIEVGWSNPCIEIWFDCYFGNMHTYQGSVECCNKFADTYKKVTEKKYAKSDSQIYQILNQYGNEAKAIKIADAKLKEHAEDGVSKPSEMCTCTTLHTLIREIKNKVADTQ